MLLTRLENDIALLRTISMEGYLANLQRPPRHRLVLLRSCLALDALLLAFSSELTTCAEARSAALPGLQQSAPR